MITDNEKLRVFLDRKVGEYNKPSFIADDPVSIPHAFQRKQDIEIAGFFAAIFSWGNRTTIIKKSQELMAFMDNAPYDFIMGHTDDQLRRLLAFKHRTFNPTDLLYFIDFFRHHYEHFDSLEDAFLLPWQGKPASAIKPTNAAPARPTAPRATAPRARATAVVAPPAGAYDPESALTAFHHYFFTLEDAPPRTRKHIATPEKNSSCKRINMFLRWMVRKDNKGVDFGLWKRIPMSRLICPLDLHVARVAQRFGLLDRDRSDWQAAQQLTNQLLLLDPADPVKYDFALFGVGIMEKF